MERENPMWVFIGTMLILVLMAMIMGFPTMWMWNYLMPTIFGLPTINFWQALVMNIFSGWLFKSVPRTK